MATRTRVGKESEAEAKPLAEYKRKRDFSKTAEPAGKACRSSLQAGAALRHSEARGDALHFDFRLELDGVMKSWAVPKGPSYDPAVKRLAMEVEDHPIEYNTFEGTIPKGEYGGGTVMLWDRGTYEPEAGGGDEALREGYARGDLKIVLHGERLEGGWVLVRMRRGESGRAQWLLIKHRDDQAEPRVRRHRGGDDVGGDRPNDGGDRVRTTIACGTATALTTEPARRSKKRAKKSAAKKAATRKARVDRMS